MQAGREIEFRGKAITENGIECLPKWVYGNLIVANNGDCFITQWTRTVVGEYRKITYQVIPETVGQFIGLRDKNGRKIYEGDIDGTDGVNMYVAFEDGEYGLKYKKGDRYFDNCINWDQCEIIGNIHENPELLQVG
ncbi:hypothetical protein QO009_003009 [Brevibacillus aydinogluensis]|jgi:hypothetical protein|uniref:YopX family protein n=1 Tax=Brevibacillus aydinogluensis TaxID=927786 RepID=UPI002893308F|nr:YopX family protein [Brevibacillus aydinogluensis]MDT3417114.1 hypothetical protein [Brevibacillus aydinogluensis]